ASYRPATGWKQPVRRDRDRARAGPALRAESCNTRAMSSNAMNDSVKPAGASSVDESAIGTGSLATTSRSAPAPGRGSTSARRRDPAGRGGMKRQALQDPGPVRRLSPLDRLLTVVTRGLADATTEPVAGKPSPARGLPEGLPKEGTPGSSHGEG